MKKGYNPRKFISAIFIALILLYFLFKTPEHKIIFLPFLLCAFAKCGQYIAVLCKNEKLSAIFQKLFLAGFFLFLFGFLAAVFYLSVRDRKYQMLLFSVPFWIAGILFARKFFASTHPDKRKKERKYAIPSPILISGILVLVVLLVGIGIFILGIIDHHMELRLFGAFFFFGGLAFVLGALANLGVFKKMKIDIIGVYMGALIAIVGIVIIVVKYADTCSVKATLETFGFWIAIPVLMIVAGIAAVIRALHKKNSDS